MKKRFLTVLGTTALSTAIFGQDGPSVSGYGGFRYGGPTGTVDKYTQQPGSIVAGVDGNNLVGHFLHASFEMGAPVAGQAKTNPNVVDQEKIKMFMRGGASIGAYVPTTDDKYFTLMFGGGLNMVQTDKGLRRYPDMRATVGLEGGSFGVRVLASTNFFKSVERNPGATVDGINKMSLGLSAEAYIKLFNKTRSGTCAGLNY